MSEKNKQPILTTPKGTAKWATLGKPDTTFKAEGEYRVSLLLPEGSKEAQDLVAALTKAYKEAVEAAKKELLADPKKKAKAKSMKVADLPFKKETDKEGNETENLQFTFKAKASGKKKDGTPWNFRPAIFDAKLKPISPSVSIWGGSVIRVSYRVNPFYTDMVGAGITLKLEGVQVIDLKTGSGRDAASMGFAEEEGYEAPQENSGGDDTDTPADNGDIGNGSDF